MSLELVGSNTLVVAQQFNPTILSQSWLSRNGILAEVDFRKGCIFTDMAVQVEADEFHLLVVPPQCQFTPRVEVERQQRLVVDKVGRIVRYLPHTPYRAVGLNFTWHLTPEDGDTPAASRRLFFMESGPLHKEFVDANPRYGAYMSKDVFGVRMKLDAKPLILNVGEEDERELLQFSFNFHKDVWKEESPVDCIEETLQKWDEAHSEALRIVQSVHAKMLGNPA